MKCSQAGFSLMELMIVVAIIGILSSLAIPRYKQFQGKSRQAEAKNNLAHIYTLQHSYYGDNDQFGNLATTGRGQNCDGTQTNDIGFDVRPCKTSRYQYTSTADNEKSKFIATALSGAGGANKVMPGCPADLWIINQDREWNPTDSGQTPYNSVTRCNQ